MQLIVNDAGSMLIIVGAFVFIETVLQKNGSFHLTQVQ
jgi:hypothetical protein